MNPKEYQQLEKWLIEYLNENDMDEVVTQFEMYNSKRKKEIIDKCLNTTCFGMWVSKKKISPVLKGIIKIIEETIQRIEEVLNNGKG